MLEFGLKALSLFLVLATAIALVPSGWKWIRIFDFPRLQIAALILLVLATDVAVLPAFHIADVILVCALILALLYQLWQILPYTPLAPVQVRTASDFSADACLRLMISNVRMENRQSHRVLDVVESADPDIVVFVETDAWWDDALAPLLETYGYAVRHPQENFYGMVMYSRLPILEHELQFLTDSNVPSIHAEILLRSGTRVVVRAIHPVPPPLADTYRRDAEILLAGKLCVASPLPNIVVGDLNDVGWSKITRLFVRTSGLVDPRVGRGLFASYHAQNPLFRWPLDHIFHDPVFSVRKIALLPHVGSDHFPILAELCYEPSTKVPDRAPEANRRDHKAVRELVREGKNTSPAPNEYPPKSATAG